MAEASAIEWCDSTFNPWIGCQKVSAACDHCYAEAWAKRFNGPDWGPHAERRRTSPSTWAQPRKWQREADAFEALHERPRFVFCASLADVFDNAVPKEWRDDLWELIRECDRLVWLMLTKRPQNIRDMLPADWGDGWPHIWLGATIESQSVADKQLPWLASIPTQRRFLSCEPLLGPLNLRAAGFASILPNVDQIGSPYFSAVDWVIAGGESGSHARPSHPDWFRSLRDQCALNETAFLFKQWGEWIPYEFGQPPELNAQNGDWLDKNLLPDFNTGEAQREGWSDALMHAGKETAIHKRVGKKAAGRALDGEIHDGRPEALIHA